MESTLYGIHALLLIRCKISLILQIRQQLVYIYRTQILSMNFSTYSYLFINNNNI